MLNIKKVGCLCALMAFCNRLKERKKGDVDGSYYFEGTIDFGASNIKFQGKQWIDFPIGADVFGLFEFRGDIDVEKGTISGTIANGNAWEVHRMDYTDFDVDWGFTLGKDNNSFYNTNTKDGGGFSDLKNYPLDDNYYVELIKSDCLLELFNNFKRLDAAKKESWNGACYGIATTMGLLFNNTIDIGYLYDGDASTYFELPKPCEDPKLLNVIEYYFLSQRIPAYSPATVKIAGTASIQRFGEVNAKRYIDSSMHMFLSTLIDEVKNNGIKRLSYMYLKPEKDKDGKETLNSHAHTILAVGCRYDSKKSSYIVKLYDMDSVMPYHEKGEFSEMVISKDCNNFKICDFHGITIADSSNYLAISFSDFELINDISKLSPASGSSSEPTAEEEIDPSHALIDISLDNDFTVTSGDLNLQCSEGKLSSTMGVYDIMPYIDGDSARFYIEVDNYPDFTIIPQAETLDIAIMQDGYYMALEAENFDSAYCNTSDRTLTMRGNDYNYKAFMGVDCMVGENEGGLISLEGNSLCNITIDDEGGCAVITSDGVPFNDITLKSYITTDVYEKTDIPTTESYLFSGEYQGHTLLYGDTNFDGRVTAADSLKVLRKSINIDKFDILKDKLADVNSDGKVNAKDALLIQRYTIGLKNTGAAGRSAE